MHTIFLKKLNYVVKRIINLSGAILIILEMVVVWYIILTTTPTKRNPKIILRYSVNLPTTSQWMMIKQNNPAHMLPFEGLGVLGEYYASFV